MIKKSKSPRKRVTSMPPPAVPGALEAMAAEQGVKPIANPEEELVADFWPEDETAEQFVEAVRQWRRAGNERDRVQGI